jgi:hypothetical protein
LRKILVVVIKGSINLFVSIRFIWPLVYLYSRVIEEVRPKSGKVDNNKPTILAINPDRFRGDLEILANSNKFRLLKLPFDWQCYILALFNISEMMKKYGRDVYFNPRDNMKLIKKQYKSRKLLKIFLPSLYTRLKVDFVIGAAAHFRHDIDWGMVSNEIGTPYIVLHRESAFMSSPKGFNWYSGFMKKRNGFKGRHIIVHSEIAREVFLDSDYIASKDISVLGNLRMDEYVARVKSYNNAHFNKSSHIRKKVTLFSFVHGIGLEGLKFQHWSENHNQGFVRLFEHVHVSMARLAMQMRDVDFVIKPKWGGSWITKIETVLKDNDIDVNKIKNLSILPDTNVHNLIFESAVVCAFQSTTMLEAAIHVDKKVIVPYFDEAKYPEYEGYLQFEDCYHLFDVAHSVDEFEKLIIEGLEKPKRVDEDLLRKRYALFEKYVSSLEGDALDKYVNVINQVIKERQCV